MPTYSQTVYVDVDLDDFEDEDLSEELQSRGYMVSEKNAEPEFDIVAIEQCWNRGNKKEALILLERKFPELIGIAKLAD